jgi:hypothetical protein
MGGTKGLGSAAENGLNFDTEMVEVCRGCTSSGSIVGDPTVNVRTEQVAHRSVGSTAACQALRKPVAAAAGTFNIRNPEASEVI